jgi:hypothetical protein
VKRLLLLTIAVIVVGGCLTVSTAGAAPSSAASHTFATTAVTPSHAAAAQREWWGYRLDRWQTWAVATQSPSYIKSAVIPFFGAYVFAQAWVWKLTAQNARSMNQCLGITWYGAGLIVGCP